MATAKKTTTPRAEKAPKIELPKLVPGKLAVTVLQIRSALPQPPQPSPLFRVASAVKGVNAMRIVGTIRAAQQAWEDFETARISLCEQLGALNEATNNYEFTHDAQVEFDKQVGLMLNETVFVTGYKLTADDVAGTEINGLDMFIMPWLFEG